MGGGLKSFWMGGDSNHGPSGPEAETLPLRHSPLPHEGLIIFLITFINNQLSKGVLVKRSDL